MGNAAKKYATIGLPAGIEQCPLLAVHSSRPLITESVDGSK